MSQVVWITNQQYQVFNSEYEIIESDKCSNVKLEFGSIHTCRRKYDGKLFGVKKILKSKLTKMSPSSDEIIKGIKNEIDVLKKIDHRYIVNIYEIYETQTILHIVIDQCIGGQLCNKLKIQKRLTEINCKSIVKMLCIALQYMHDQYSIVHCGLNPNNILFVDDKNNSNVKITNFCLNPSPTKITNYTAPEIITNKNDYSHLSDMWSVGVITFVMIFGFHPFRIRNINQFNTERELQQFCKLIRKGFQNKIKRGFGAFFPASMSGILSQSGMDFISQLIKNKANKRMTAKKALKHPWIRDVVLKTDENKNEEEKVEKFEKKEQTKITYAYRKNRSIKNARNRKEDDEIFTIERVHDALQNNDKNEIIEMFNLLLEQTKEYQQKIEKLERDNVSLEKVIETVSAHNISLIPNKCYENERLMDETRIKDMMTPLSTGTPVRTYATPIYGIDL